jgi:hypothetical protein
MKVNATETARLVRREASGEVAAMEELNRTWHETSTNTVVTEEAIRALVAEVAAEYFQEHGVAGIAVRFEFIFLFLLCFCFLFVVSVIFYYVRSFCF